MKKKNLLKVLSNDNFLILNRDLIKELGLDEAILLCELCHEQYYWEMNKKLQKDGTFYSTVENIEKQIGLKKKKQLTLLNKLKVLNLVEVKYHDMPKKRYIKVNISELEEILNKYKERKKERDIVLTEKDYDTINKVFFEYDLSKELKNLFSELVLVLKQHKDFEVTLKNVRGLGKSLLQFKSCTVEEQKKIIHKSINGKWSGFYPLKKIKDPYADMYEKKLQQQYNSYNNYY